MKSRRFCSFNFKWIFTVSLITLGVYISFRYLLPLILPFIFAYFLAWLIRPVVETLYRRLKIPRILGGTISLLLLVGVFGTAICMLINILIRETIAMIRNIPIYINMIADKLDTICKHCDDLMGISVGTVRGIVDEHLTQSVNDTKTKLMPWLTEHTISITIWLIGFLTIFLIVFIAAVLIAKDLPEFHKRYEKNPIYCDIHKVTEKLSEAGIAYLRTQLIIMLIVAVVCVIALIILKNDYAFLIGIGIAFLDALPILGIGLVLIPWSIISLIQGKLFVAAIIFTAFLICQIVREVLEPKLIGNRIGIKPLYTLIAMFIGIKLFSIAGFILGPIGLVIITTIYKVLNDKPVETEKDNNTDYIEE